MTLDHATLPGLALNVADDGGAPEWVQLTPPGPDVTGRDGRSWFLPNPEEVVAAFRRNGADLPVDFEHATEIKGGAGEAAPAIGWIRDMQVREGAVWASVDWLDEGRKAVATRAYRYLSPVFTFEQPKGEIVQILSAGLTNQPNLRMAALNRQTPKTEIEMDLTALTNALELDDGASPEQIAKAVNRLKSSAASPPLEKFVPRADYDTALNRATAAEGRLAEIEAARADAEIDTAVDAAIEAGKVAPASRDYHIAACRADGGLAAFRAYADAAPVIAGPADPGGKAPAGGGSSLTDDEKAVCRMRGISEADFKKLKAGESA